MKDSKKNKIAVLLMMTLCFGLMFINAAQASEKSPLPDPNKLTGKITDAYTSVPLAGATVQIKGTDTKAVTGKDGTYSLDLAKGAKTVIMSYTGYKTLEIDIKGRRVINTVMSPAGASNSLWE